MAYVFDVAAIKKWADSAGNEKQVVLAAVQAGEILICNRIWNSAVSAYPDECEQLPKDEFEKMQYSDLHRQTAVAVVDRLQARFPFKSPYDDASEWAVTGIALCEDCTIVTDERRKARYLRIDGLSVLTYEEFLADL